MASKVVLVALVLVALVTAAAAAGESGHAVPLRRAEQNIGWMNGMKGGPPSGMQPSGTVAATTAHRRAVIGEKGSQDLAGGEKEGKSLAPAPSFRMPPLPPNAA